MFDVKATRAWWDFFHRFSLVYAGGNFDYIVMLGLNLLQCQQCQDDAIPFYRTIGAHKNPFEKINILHNYVNRKLKKKVFSLDETRKYIADIIGINGEIVWSKLLSYYHNLIFNMTDYINEKQLNDFKEFTAYVYSGLNLPKKDGSMAVNIIYKGKFNRELLQMQTYEYYQRLNESLNQALMSQKNMTQARSLMGTRSYSEVYGQMPKKPRTCSACARKHKLYLEAHNIPKVDDKNVKPTIATPLPKPRIVTAPPARTNLINRQPTGVVRLNEEKRKPPSLVKKPVERQKPMKTPKKSPEKRAKPLATENKVVGPNIIIRQVVRKNQTIRKKVIPVAKPKINKDVVYRRSRIVRYKQNPVVSKNGGEKN